MPRKKKDPDMPKRPLSSYMFYSKERRPKLQEEQPNLEFGEYSKLIAGEWKLMTEDDKADFVKLSNKDKGRYEVELAAYKEKKKNEPKPDHNHKDFTTQENIDHHIMNSHAQNHGMDPRQHQAFQNRGYPENLHYQSQQFPQAYMQGMNVGNMGNMQAMHGMNGLPGMNLHVQQQQQHQQQHYLRMQQQQQQQANAAQTGQQNRGAMYMMPQAGQPGHGQAQQGFDQLSYARYNGYYPSQYAHPAMQQHPQQPGQQQAQQAYAHDPRQQQQQQQQRAMFRAPGMTNPKGQHGSTTGEESKEANSTEVSQAQNQNAMYQANNGAAMGVGGNVPSPGYPQAAVGGLGIANQQAQAEYERSGMMMMQQSQIQQQHQQQMQAQMQSQMQQQDFAPQGLNLAHESLDQQNSAHLLQEQQQQQHSHDSEGHQNHQGENKHQDNHHVGQYHSGGLGEGDGSMQEWQNWEKVSKGEVGTVFVCGGPLKGEFGYCSQESEGKAMVMIKSTGENHSVDFEDLRKPPQDNGISA